MWRICPLLGNRSVNTFLKHILSTIEGHALLGNGPINTHSWQQKMVFSMGSVPRSYKRARSELKEYEWVQGSSVGSQNSSCGVSSQKKMTVCQMVIVNCFNQLYKGPINSIIRSKKPSYLVMQTPDTCQYLILNESTQGCIYCDILFYKFLFVMRLFLCHSFP
jgi:hypothetical protein